MKKKTGRGPKSPQSRNARPARGGRDEYKQGPARGGRDENKQERPARGGRDENKQERPARGGRDENKQGRLARGGRDENRQERRVAIADRPSRGRDRDREQGRERDTEQAYIPNVGEHVEGRHPVLEALKANRTINKILLAEGASGGVILDILGAAREKSVVVQTVPKNKLDLISDSRNHQGVIAYIAAKDYVEIEDIVEAANSSTRPGLIIVLDEIEDPFNLGSILRTADGVGAHGVVIPKRRAVPLTATVAKASAGAIEHIPVARVTNISQTLEQLKKMGFWVVGTDVDADKMYHQVEMTGPLVMVIGNEGKGLGEVVKKRCDYLVRLPMIGQVQSLNAGVATGIMLYEVLRQRGEKR